MPLETLTLDPRFCGPSQSGNGGYTCGRIARHIPGAASVRLSIPPPFNTQLCMEQAGDRVRLMQGETLVGEGRPVVLDLDAPPPVSFDEAVEAATFYVGFQSHHFPRCFVCGPAREEHDGLRIFAGRKKDDGPVAAPWIVDASLAENGTVGAEFLWAALDCPGAFAIVRGEMSVVLGELAADIRGTVSPGDRCVAMGWDLGKDGRKHMAGSAVFSEKGNLLGIARATWIEIPKGLFPPEGSQ